MTGSATIVLAHKPCHCVASFKTLSRQAILIRSLSNAYIYLTLGRRQQVCIYHGVQHRTYIGHGLVNGEIEDNPILGP